MTGQLNNYKEQLDWFNKSVKPFIVTDYQKNSKRGIPNPPSPNNNLNRTPSMNSPDSSNALFSNERPSSSLNEVTSSLINHASSSTIFSNGDIRLPNFNNRSNTDSYSININNDNRTNINLYSTNVDNNDMFTSPSRASKNTPYYNSNSDSNSNNYTTTLKRAIDYDIPDTIDLTESQTKRTKLHNDRPTPTADFEQNVDNDFGYDDGFAEDDLIEEFGQDDDFGPDDDNEWDRNHPEPMEIIDDFDEEYPPIDTDLIMNLEQISTHQENTDVLKVRLQLLSDRQKQKTADMQRAINNGAMDEIAGYSKEFGDLSTEISQIKKMIEKNDNAAQERPQVVVLDDDKQTEVSPFFSRTPTMPTPTTIKTTANTSLITKRSALASSSQPTFAWSRDVRKALTQTFKLSEFRTNQLEAVNTTLNGDDVFVLMPTGGGKSLCYQLPAIIQRYKRQGITFVVSPLLSLMQDQVEQLVKGRGIGAFMLNSTIEAQHKKHIFNELYNPQTTMQLLYVTPELLCQSSQLKTALDNLHRRNKIARFVIDEAHCVSQWGHDFRPDYKLLSFLKQTYDTVPIMALTATANEAVQTDVINNLHMKNCKVLKQSFNRDNLLYQIVPKGAKNCLNDIQKFIKEHRNKSGIIYCCTKNDCEKVASELQKKYSVSIKHYHAGMSPAERSIVQREWQSGRIQVIAATIAFGMGIDKPDVRFVAHYSVPSSLEGYYQETGRAGRDGLPATCRLYYCFGDTRMQNYLIEKGEGDFQQKRRRRDNLNTMMRFCDNETDCRRKQIMGYFGERFDSGLCNNMCDNCIRDQQSPSVFKDMSREAIVLVKLVKQILPEDITIPQLAEIYRGSKCRKILSMHYDRLEGHGYGRGSQKLDVDRLLRSLTAEDVFAFKFIPNGAHYPTQTVLLGSKADGVLNGRKKICIGFRSNIGSIFNNPRPTINPGPSAQTAISGNSGFVSAGTMCNRSTAHLTASRTTAIKTNPAAEAAASSAKPAPTKKKGPANEFDLKFLQELQNVRQTIMSQHNVKNPTYILSDTSLKHVVAQIPLTDREFAMVTHMKDEMYQKFGKPFLEISIKYDRIKKAL